VFLGISEDKVETALAMVSARWEHIKDIFESALLHDEHLREAFVSDCCRGDSNLEAEINLLLIADRQSSDFLDVPLLDVERLLSSQAPNGFLSSHQVLCGRFEVLAYLGEGGMGQVYEALDLELRQHIAIKAIRREIADNPGVLSRFKREVYATRKVTHPNVCRTFDLERHTFPDRTSDHPENGITFLTMELLRGETLARRLRRVGPLPLDQAHLFALQTARALLSAHDAGIIHCDLKPSNIFITTSESSFRAVITDFGIAKFILPQDQTCLSQFPGQSTFGGQIVGTPIYMAPEQFERGQCTPSSDLYSYGLILYEALTGERPSSDDYSLDEIQEKLKKTVEGSIGQAFPLDPIWSIVISGCLQVDPKERFSQAQQILDLFTAASSHELAIIETSVQRESSSDMEEGVFLWRQFKGIYSSVALSSRALLFGSLLLILVTIGVVGYGILRSARSRSIGDIPSVAVLPFVNLDGNPDLNYICHNITIALTNELAQVSGLRVPSQSVIHSLGTQLDLKSVGGRLNVDTILSGSVSKVSDQLVLQIELIDAITGVQLWGESYVRNEADLESVQQDIAQEIAFRLRLKIDSSSNRRIERQRSKIPAAQVAYRKGQDAMGERTPSGFDRAVNSFQEAIDDDPQYAPALAELANCYVLMAYNYNRPEAPLALMTKAEESARRALRLDSTLAEAYSSLADVEMLRDFNWKAAEGNYSRTLQLNPSYLPVHISYGLILLTALGRFAEARAQLAYAQREAPDDLMTHLSRAIVAYYARQYDSSIEQSEIIRKRFPQYEGADEILAGDYVAKNQPAKAIKLLLLSKPLSEDSQILKAVMLGIAYAKMDQRRKALLQLQRVEKAERPGFILFYHVAALSAIVGDKDRAFRYLEKSYSNRQTSILFLNVDPLMDPLRPDPRFRELLTKLNLH
jgi:serine/threonine protein kinase